VAEESQKLAERSVSVEESVSTQQNQEVEATQIEAEDVEMTQVDVPARTITEIDEEEEVDSENHSSTLALTPMNAEISN
jgi:regulator of protease activity HflC (stomatin/prohibitin superfamily)